MSWQKEDGALTRTFERKNFVDAVDFVGQISVLAERADHHPDVLIYGYKKVKIMLFTHSENKITEKDYELAREIDGI